MTYTTRLKPLTNQEKGKTMKHIEAEELFLTARNKGNGKPIANNTRLHQRGNDYAVRLHNTDVVTIHDDDTYTLNSGGWRTVTTKERINRFSPAQVYSDRKTWLVAGSLFEDGMKVGSRGAVFDFKDPAEGFALQRKLDNLVRNYINGFCDMIAAKELKDPSAGDCWYCSMFNQDKAHGNKESVDHLFSHFEEKYYVPSLLANALKERNYGNVGYVWQLTKAGGTDWARMSLRNYFKNRQEALLEHMKG